MPLNLGLVGCGRIAGKHLRTMSQLKEVRLVAVSDVDQKRMDQAAATYRQLGGAIHRIKKHAEYRELLADPNVDAVVITAFSSLHATIALQALEAGKPVLLEKPIALSLQEAQKLAALSEEKALPVLVCHQMRYRPFFREVKRRIEAGSFGRILYGSVSLNIRRDEQYYAEASWRGSWEHDGGMLMNQGTHLLDLLLWYMGEPTQIQSRIMRLADSKKQIEDAALSILDFHNGSSALVDANVVSYPDNLGQSLHLFGETGMTAVGGPYANEMLRWSAGGMSEEQAKQLYSDKQEHVYMYQDFLQAAEQGTEPLSSAAEAKKVLELILAMYRSAAERRPVHISEAVNSPYEFGLMMGWC